MEICNWLSSFTIGVLALVSIALYVDVRGQRKALGAAQKAITALQFQVKAQDVALDLLSLCIPSMDPQRMRSATAIPRALPDDALPAPSKIEQIQRSLDSLRAQDGHVPPALVRHWEGLLASARAEADEEAPTSEPRPIPWERVADLSAEEIAACDALAERLGLSREEAIRYCTELALEHMTPEKLREAILADRARTAGLTTPPDAPANDSLTPTETDQLDPRVARRWAEKIAAASLAGVDLAHCGSEACAATPRSTGECDCECEPCARRAALLVDAAREILGGR